MDVVPLYIFGMKLTWSCWIIFLMYSWNQYANISLRIFAYTFMLILIYNFLFCWVFVQFRYQLVEGNSDLTKRIRKFPSVFILWNNLMINGIKSWYISGLNPSGSVDFFLVVVLFVLGICLLDSIASISLVVWGLFKLVFDFDLDLVWACCKY